MYLKTHSMIFSSIQRTNEKIRIYGSIGILTGDSKIILRVFKEQVIKSCSSEDVPVSIGLVVDTSGSMGHKVDLMKAAAIQFLRVGNQSDEYFLIRFRNHPQLVLPFTADTDQLLHSMDQMQAGGSTALFDAINLAVNEMRHASYPRKALLVVSDCMDNHSRYSERQLRRRISEIDFPIYTINVWSPQRGNRYAIQRRDPAVLETFPHRPEAGTIQTQQRRWSRLKSLRGN